MDWELVNRADAAIREALSRIERQREFVEEFSARGYDMRQTLCLLSSLILNLKRLEHDRRELVGAIDDVAVV